MIKRFIAYYKPYKNLFFLDMAASILISAIGLVYPIITNLMLNDFIKNRKYAFVIIGGSVVLVLYFIRMLLRYFVQYYGHIIGTNMQADMRRDMFRHLETLPYSYFDNTETGTILSRMTNDLFDVVEYIVAARHFDGSGRSGVTVLSRIRRGGHMGDVAESCGRFAEAWGV